MPTIGWIDALRTYNAGMPSWCVPRKGTPGYERVMRIRQGEETKGFKEVLEDLERKTSGKPKKEKKSMAIDLAEPSKEVQEVKVPTLAEGKDIRIFVPKTGVGFRLYTKNKSGGMYHTESLVRLRIRGDEIEGRSKHDKRWRNFTSKLSDNNSIRLTGDDPIVNMTYMRQVKTPTKSDMDLRVEA
jgi:hypothetical protein